MSLRDRAARRAASGFSLVELLVVIGIIAIISAVALPGLMGFLQTYKIKGAAQQVSGEITAARNRAIMKNVNFGVVFYAMTPTQYRWALEDDQTPPRLGRAMTLAEAQADPVQVGPVQLLPEGVEFAAGCPGFTANTPGFRFNRLGARCALGATGCPALAGAPANRMMNAATETRICLVQQATGLSRLLRVAPGGRVLTGEGQ